MKMELRRKTKTVKMLKTMIKLRRLLLILVKLTLSKSQGNQILRVKKDFPRKVNQNQSMSVTSILRVKKIIPAGIVIKPLKVLLL